MKKKMIQKQSEERLKQIESLQALLGRRREEIRELRAECEGLEQLANLCAAIIVTAIKERGRIEIPKNKLKENLDGDLVVGMDEDKYIVEIRGGGDEELTPHPPQAFPLPLKGEGCEEKTDASL